MPLKLAPVFRACCVAGALILSGVQAADQKPTLVGATRDEAIARLGEPKSQIAVGNRQVLYFARERVVVRDGRVIEVEELAVEVVPQPATAKTEPEDSAESPAPVSAAPSAAPGLPAEVAALLSAQTEGSARENGHAAPATAEPGAVIKSVRPPQKAKTGPANSSKRVNSPAAAAPTPAAPNQARPEFVQKATTPLPAVAVSNITPASAPSTRATESAPAESLNAAQAPAEAPEAAASVPVSRATSKPVQAVAERSEDLPEMAAHAFTAQTYIIGLFTIGGGIGYLVWRARQRRLELDATAVSNHPFEPSVATGATVRFTHDLLAQLEWKRFEELVTAYYNKTGVVAVRTKTGPMSPVHIKISWKGEQRPFACVKCIAHPVDLIDVKPLQELCASIEAEEIRRGYVVTSGRFSVPARDLAEEKHITLLPGDLFLEKLNALPEPAKAELMKAATTGDYTTPTCPMCDIAMAKTPEGRWGCVQCGTVLPR